MNQGIPGCVNSKNHFKSGKFSDLESVGYLKKRTFLVYSIALSIFSPSW